MTINSETLQKPLSEADNPNLKIKLIFIEYSGKKTIFAAHCVGFAIPWIFTARDLLEIHGSFLLITHKECKERIRNVTDCQGPVLWL